MVAGFIFLLHILLVVFAFFKFKKESMGEGFLAIAFVGIVFAVGWTIAAILTNLLFTPEWFIKWYWQPLDSWMWRSIRKEISRDTISLLFLTAMEIVFYYFYFLTEPKQDDEKKKGPNTPTTSA
jgi:small-conductance mechanosensitive channel